MNSVTITMLTPSVAVVLPPSTPHTYAVLFISHILQPTHRPQQTSLTTQRLCRTRHSQSFAHLFGPRLDVPRCSSVRLTLARNCHFNAMPFWAILDEGFESET